MLDFKLGPKGLFVIWAFVFSLQGCAQTRFGQDLAKNFGSSVAMQQVDNVKEKKVLPRQVSASELKSNQMNSQIANKRQNPAKELKPARKIKAASFKPQPYRVTIKLSGANPSAPAEEVTKALRSAGVSFHVEKIERIESKNLLKVKPVRTGI